MMQGAYREMRKRVGLRSTMFAFGLMLVATSAWAQDQPGLIPSLQDMAIHGYVDNFSILRNDNFATWKDYHFATSRYRASVQLSGPLRVMQDMFNRFEYFIELRPEYESIYDLSDRFGTGRNNDTIAVSGRTRMPRPNFGGPDNPNNNYHLLTAFGFNPHKFAEFWPIDNALFPYNLVPGSKYNVPGRLHDSRPRAYFGLDESQNDLRFGMLRETNMDLYYPVREAYFDMFFDALGGRNWLRIGKQQHVWGKADFFRLQDIVNPVNFADHFFIDLFDDTRVPLWSALFEHRFGQVGPLKDLAGSIVWVFDRYTPLGFGNSAQPWAIGFGRTLDAFAFGNDLFGQALFPGQNNVNMALYKNRAPSWNLGHSGIGTRWEATVGNFRLQLTDWFAYQDVPAFGWDRMNILEGVPGCADVLPAVDPNNPMGPGGSTVQSAFGPTRINVKPKEIRMRDAPIGGQYGVQNAKKELKAARYMNLCAMGGSLAARYRASNTLGFSLDWFEPATGFVIRSETSWVTNALVTDTTKPDILATANIYRWVLGVDRPTLIRWLNPTRSFFLSFQAFGTHLPDVHAGRYGNPNGANNNFIFTFFVQNQFMRDQLVFLLFGAFGTTGLDGTTGGNVEYLITNNWSVQLGITAFLGSRQEHDLNTFAVFTRNRLGNNPKNPNYPWSESGFGIGHMQAGGSERSQMDEFWGRIRYRF